jgi:hypothetical protein
VRNTSKGWQTTIEAIPLIDPAIKLSNKLDMQFKHEGMSLRVKNIELRYKIFL